MLLVCHILESLCSRVPASHVHESQRLRVLTYPRPTFPSPRVLDRVFTSPNPHVPVFHFPKSQVTNSHVLRPSPHVPVHFSSQASWLLLPTIFCPRSSILYHLVEHLTVELSLRKIFYAHLRVLLRRLLRFRDAVAVINHPWKGGFVRVCWRKWKLMIHLFRICPQTDFRALLRKWNITSGDWSHDIVNWPENPLADLENLITIS